MEFLHTSFTTDNKADSVLSAQTEQLTPGAGSAKNKFEHPRDFGKWKRLGSSDGDSVLLNSSHVYPLSVQWYLDAIGKFIAGEPYSPLFLELRPTNLCNHDCPVCFAHDTRSDFARLSQPRVTSLIEETNSLEIPVIRFCGGGEPLAWAGIDKAIEQADEADIGVVLITNGGLLGKLNESLAEHSRYIRISINGGPNSHYIMHGCSPDDFPKIVQNMGSISRIRANNTEIANRLYLGTTYLVIPGNLEEIYTTAWIVKDSGWDAVYFRTPTPNNGYTKEEKLTLAEQKEKCDELIDDNFFPHFAGSLFGLNANSRTNRCFCYHSQFRLYVEATGNMSFCGLFSVTNLNSLGNINKGRLDDLWKIGEARLNFKARDEVNCTTCEKRHTCVHCDSVYFNEAMDFVVRKIRANKDVTFHRIFE